MKKEKGNDNTLDWSLVANANGQRQSYLILKTLWINLIVQLTISFLLKASKSRGLIVFQQTVLSQI